MPSRRTSIPQGDGSFEFAAHRQPARGNAERRLSCRGPWRGLAIAAKICGGELSCACCSPLRCSLCRPSPSFSRAELGHPADASWTRVAGQDPRLVRNSRSRSRPSPGATRCRKLADYARRRVCKTAGFAADDIKIMPYEGDNRRQDASRSIARWRADKPTAEADPADGAHGRGRGQARRLEARPVRVPSKKDGYFYGRGTNDNKAGHDRPRHGVPQAEAQSGFKPNRDLILVLHRRRGNRAATARGSARPNGGS